MQKQYLMQTQMHFSDFKIVTRPGDVAIHDEQTKHFSVFRSGELIGTPILSLQGRDSFLKNKWMIPVAPDKEKIVIVEEPVAPKVVRAEPKIKSEKRELPLEEELISLIDEPEDDPIVIDNSEPVIKKKKRK